MDGFKLGRLFHHMVGGDDFAAIMKPGGQIKFVPFHIGQVEIGKWSKFVINCGLRQHARNHRNARTMIGRMRRLGINRMAQYAHETFHQIALCQQKTAVFNRNRGLTGQCGDDWFD